MSFGASLRLHWKDTVSPTGGVTMIDLQPAADTVARIVGGVRDDQLTAPTPCTESTIGDLIDHVDGLSLAFTAAARKTPLPGGSQAPKPSASPRPRCLRCRRSRPSGGSGRGKQARKPLP
jgi:Mycothiol maleylpyruvate isomerase N-terminal domain